MKKIKSIIYILLATMALFCGCVPFNAFEKDFIEEGDFIYYYIKDEDCYAIVGTTEQGLKPTVYVPTHFRGKEVRTTSYTKYGIAGGSLTHALEVKNCERLYFSYLHIPNSPVYFGNVKTIFFANATDDYRYSRVAISVGTTAITKTGYVSAPLYDKIIEDISSSYHLESFNEIGNYYLKRTIIKNEEIVEDRNIIKANTSYIFNYEGAPNKGYFFIDDFESLSLITKVPYDPIRDGYSFAGWYKEAECINVWDFDNDRLPKFEYDSDGYITNFTETKLYAKWIKV